MVIQTTLGKHSVSQNKTITHEEDHCGKQEVWAGMGEGGGKVGSMYYAYLGNCQGTILINKQRRNKFSVGLVSLISNVCFAI